MLQHPVTTEFHSARFQILETLKAVKALDRQTIWLWPNIDSGSDEIAKALRQYGKGKIRFFRNFAAEDYGYLLSKTACLIGNSSSGLRSGAFLGAPVVNIGNRQQHRECAGNVYHAEYNAAEIEVAVNMQTKHEPSYLYGSGDAGQQIADIIAMSELTHTKVMYGL